MENQMNDGVFVFGSNELGQHYGGGSIFAMKNHGAAFGVGVGFHGNSYAIPTQDVNFVTLPIDIIREYVNAFFNFAKTNHSMKFNVIRIGCGNAGYTDNDMAHLFNDAPENVRLPQEWKGIVKGEHEFVSWDI